jgi:hypothetical protein
VSGCQGHCFSAHSEAVCGERQATLLMTTVWVYYYALALPPLFSCCAATHCQKQASPISSSLPFSSPKGGHCLFSSMRTASSKLKPLLGRFTGGTPLQLFRVQAGLGVKLRPEAAARAAGRHSYDFTEQEGQVWPRDPAELNFLGPNGMSMRPHGNMLSVIIGTFRSPGDAAGMVFQVPAGTPMSPALVLLHEHTDHYAMQPARRMPLAELNAELTAFLAQPQVRKFSSVQNFYEASQICTPVLWASARTPEDCSAPRDLQDLEMTHLDGHFLWSWPKSRVAL